METIEIDYKKSGIGVALDVGTTTIAGACVDLSDGHVIARTSLENPQSRWGRDVVSRLEAVCAEPGLLTELSASLVGACNSIIRWLAKGAPVAGITAAGNPLMEHLLLGVSPEPLSRVPYRPAFKEAQRMDAGQTGLCSCARTELYVFPLIGGFVGGDAVAVALSLGLKGAKEPVLAIDIGTNSEILLASGPDLYATSAAAGPAFEGGQVSSGMVAG
ncbi:MAG: ASKHA domain-containing protein, partial [Thermodesulfobacteriota bacterium]